MRVKDIIDEDFQDYYKPAMFICARSCTMKCNAKAGREVCQNASLLSQDTINISDNHIVKRYLENNLTSAIVVGGLEPLDQPEELAKFADALNHHNIHDDLVIYTGYSEDEIRESDILSSALSSVVDKCRLTRNLVVKYGGFVSGCAPHFDAVLKVNLASDNQYAILYKMEDQDLEE